MNHRTGAVHESGDRFYGNTADGYYKKDLGYVKSSEGTKTMVWTDPDTKHKYRIRYTGEYPPDETAARKYINEQTTLRLRAKKQNDDQTDD